MQAPIERTGIDRDRTAVDHSSDLDRDELFELLQSGRRRQVVRHLLGFVGEAVPVDALATAIARREHDGADGLDAEIRENVALTLDHTHLPKLDAAGVVDYDREEACVTARACIDTLEPYLEVDDATATDRSVRTQALAGFAGGSLATLLALRRRTGASFGVAVLVALALLWTTHGGERRCEI